MNKALRERLDSWDLKSLVLTIGFLSVALFLFFYYGDIRDLFRANDKENYGGQTKGEIISIEPIDRITQSKWKGTKIFVDSYKVSYRFSVNGQTFQNIDVIPVSTENQQLLKSLLEVKDHATCLVKFDIKDPKKSVLFEGE
jgi:hypothetical protein